MKIREILLQTKDDPLCAAHIVGTQIPLFLAAAQRKLNAQGFPDVTVDIADISSLEQDQTDRRRSIYKVLVTLSRKTETEKFEVLFVNTHDTTNPPMVHITYSSLCSICEVDFEEWYEQKNAPVTEYIAEAILHMAGVLFGHLACRV